MTTTTQQPPAADASQPKGDATGGLIPYKNPKALIAYYLGLFSLLPVFGVLMGIAAVILGVLGLKYRKQHPETKGSVHAWIGIIAGGGSVLVQLGIVLAIVLAAGR